MCIRDSGWTAGHRLQGDSVAQRRVADAPAQVAVVPRLVATADVRVLERRNVRKAVRTTAVDRCRKHAVHK